MLSRDQILAASDLPTEEVPVPEWGGSVTVRTMTGAERDRFETLHLASKDRDFRARLAVATACDDAGKALFTEADVPLLSAKSARALDRIAAAALRLNKITGEDVADLEKN